MIMKIYYALPAAAISAILLLSGCNAGDKNANQGASVNNAATVNNTANSAAASNSNEDDFKQAIDQYREYVIQQCDAFVTETAKFTAAMKDGDLETAKSLYAPARMYYERIEPIAEALGDLDPNIDARDGDVDSSEWRGFHKLEQALWENNTTAGQEDIADQLLSDAKLLRAKVETVDIDASLLVTGAVELLNEVSTSKVTGEEERYSHTDLYDFAANVEGAKKIYELLEPQLKAKDAELSKNISERFSALEQELAPFQQGDGYISYEQLQDQDVRKLSQNLDALAEPLSQMGTLLGV